MQIYTLSSLRKYILSRFKTTIILRLVVVWPLFYVIRFEKLSLCNYHNSTSYLFSDDMIDQFGGENNKRVGAKQLKELILEKFHCHS